MIKHSVDFPFYIFWIFFAVVIYKADIQVIWPLTDTFIKNFHVPLFQTMKLYAVQSLLPTVSKAVFYTFVLSFLLNCSEWMDKSHIRFEINQIMKVDLDCRSGCS